MSTRIVAVATVLALVAAPGVAQAQGRFETLTLDSQGRGRVVQGRNSAQNLTSVNVDLRRGGAAVIQLTGARSWNVTGRWTATANDTVNLTLDRFAGAEATGTGRVFLTRRGSIFQTRRALERLELNGRSRGEAFTVTFDDRDTIGTVPPSGGNGAGFRELDETVTGTGFVDIQDRRDQEISRARVVLERNGDATLRFHGTRAQVVGFSGRWTAAGRDAVNLTLTEGPQGVSATGTGRITLGANNLVDRVDLTAEARNTRYRVRFDGREIAQDDDVRYRDLDHTYAGAGFLDLRERRDQELSRARVILERNGDAVIRLHGGRVLTFTGRWFNAEDNSVDLRIREALDTTATGTGRIFFRSGSDTLVDRIEMSGTTRNNDNYRARFQVRERVNNSEEEGDREVLEVVREGSGRLRRGNDLSEPITKVKVALKRNGHATIRFHGENRTYNFKGRWSGNLEDRIRVRLEEYEDRRATGEAILHLQRTFFSRELSVSRVEVDGTVSNTRAEIDFRTN